MLTQPSPNIPRYAPKVDVQASRLLFLEGKDRVGEDNGSRDAAPGHATDENTKNRQSTRTKIDSTDARAAGSPRKADCQAARHCAQQLAKRVRVMPAAQRSSSLVVEALGRREAEELRVKESRRQVPVVGLGRGEHQQLALAVRVLELSETKREERRHT